MRFVYRLNHWLGILAAAVAVVLVAGACGSSSPAANSSKPGSSQAPSGGKAATGSPITIGLVTPLTGSAASEYVGVAKAAQARFDQQNAAGGVGGHRLQLKVVDDTSSTTGNATATQDLISQGVLGIIQVSPFTIASARIMQQAGIPVTGSGTDGPEWGQQPNTNMFSTDVEGWDPKLPQYSLPPQVWNGTSSIAAFGYGDSPASVDAAKGFAFAAKKTGLNVSYLDLSIPFGSVDVTSIALAMKSKHVDGVYMPLDFNTNLAITTAAAQDGIGLKTALYATGYGQPLLDNPSAVKVAQGGYFSVEGAPVELHTPATEAMQKAFSTYEGFTGIPGYDWYEGWESADLMVKGLQVAGADLTRQSIIQNLRKVTDWSAGGLLATPANFTRFGQDPQQYCTWYPRLEGSRFVVPDNGKPVCATMLANSDQSS